MRNSRWWRATLVTAACLLGGAAPTETATDAHPEAGGEPPAHSLRLYNTHTGERVEVVYRLGDAYLPAAVRRLEHHLRDHRTGDVHAFDPELFDLLADLAAAVGRPGAEFHVISGYRSPETNEMLRARTTGVAKRSKTSKMRRRKPCAISMRVECTLIRVILRLHAMDFTGLPQETASAMMRVPSTSGRREFKISTGMFFSIAGTTVAGCRTLAPK